MLSLRLFIVTLLYPAFSIGQVYSNMNVQFGINVVVTDNIYGAGVSFHDFNGDGWDDLTFSQDEELKFYKNQEGVCVEQTFPFDISNTVKQPIWVDYDNDGDKDFFVSGYLDSNQLYRNDGNGNFTDVSNSAGVSDYLTPHYGASWGDYDRDGDLDLYTCNYVFIYYGSDAYDYWNHLYRNNGDGTFTDVTIESGAFDGISLSFQSVWMDYNNDLWPDLYVINDKAHPNRLFHNNGNGTFTDLGASTSSAIAPIDAMTASCGDMNNDGFTDIFVTNTSIGPCVLLKGSEAGVFSNITQSASITLNVLAWGANWFDYDLDMDQDLYVCEYFPQFPELQNKFMVNQGNETFHNLNSSIFPFDFSNSYTTACGDWNHDGYPDLAVNNYSPQNANFWLSSGGAKNSISIALEGVVSNREGIGSWISVYSGGIKQVRYTMCGENLMGQDSQYELFGLNTNTVVDSVVVEWPSGHVDRFYDIAVDQRLWLIEGSGLNVQPIAVDNELLCLGDSIVLDAGEFSSYLWGDGSTDRFLAVSEGGIYTVEVESMDGFTAIGSIVVEDAFDPGLEFNIIAPTCYESSNGEIEFLSGIWPQEFSWSGGNEFISLAPGEYFYEAIYENGCSILYDIFLQEPDSLFVIFDIQNILCSGDSTGRIELIESNAQNLTLLWDGLGESINLDSLTAGSYSYTLTDDMGCVKTGGVIIAEPTILDLDASKVDVNCFSENSGSIELSVSGGAEPYAIDWNGNDPSQLFSGTYVVQTTDANGCELIASFDILEPDELLAEIQLECESDWMNVEAIVTGGTAPYNYSWSNGSDAAILTGIPQGSVLTLFVYDENGCELFLAGIECMVNVQGMNESSVEIFPNPFNDVLIVQTPNSQIQVIRLMDAQGKLLAYFNLNDSNSIYLGDFANGMYFIECLDVNMELVHRQKLLKN